MGDRIQKIAGIIFALTFVAILALMNQQVLHFGSDVNRQVHNSSTVSVDYELEPFNGTFVSGDTVVSAINNRNSLSSSSLSVLVIDSGGGEMLYDANTPDKYDQSSGNVELSSKYKAELATNANGVVHQILFTEES